MYNFEIICRTCSSEGELQSLFIEDTVLIADMLTEIVDLKVMRDDKYPQNICTHCLNKLKSAYTFKKQCQSVQIKFEQYLQNLIVKDEIQLNDNNQIKHENQSIKVENLEKTVWNDDNHHRFDDNGIDNDDDSSSISSKVDGNNEMNDDYVHDTITIIEDNYMRTNNENDKLDENQKTNVKKKRKIVYKRNHQCTVCNKTFTSSHLQNHMRSHTKEKPFKCEQCGQQFSLKGNYERHRKIHTGERPHACTTCGRRFLQKTTLNQHLLIHTDETPYMCTYCGRRFKHKSPLQWHIRTKHNPNNETIVKERKPARKRRTQLPRNFECDICHKKFSTKNILATHTLIHGEKTYLCSHCGKGFVSNNGLQSHLRTHTGEKPHKCTLCDKAFSQIASLHTHRLIHTGERPFTCDVCNQSFKQVNHLKTHRRTHSGEKLYKCSVCAKHFSTNGNLTVHMRTHTGETPYVCTVCNKGFYDSSSMKKHKKKHFTDGENVQEKSFDLSLTKYIEK